MRALAVALPEPLHTIKDNFTKFAQPAPRSQQATTQLTVPPYSHNEWSGDTGNYGNGSAYCWN
ncbi:hypothetical protein BDP27DRAFT_1425440 [Rhodocollybia butyracea]|uniref:Uncharacterized protein n=1 Tax=Rhodocollybia butyracea TaxID=206335 RepID=A0A9P5U3Q5_9AGAR|nr:hypothetical protein BDP27DRAFT_1425440 [Rhodocollybia butyracea]